MNSQLALTQKPKYLVFQNELSHLVDSLAYIDSAPEGKLALEVDRLVEEERRRLGKKDYLKDIPMPLTPISDQAQSLTVGRERAPGGETVRLERMENNERRVNLELYAKQGEF